MINSDWDSVEREIRNTLAADGAPGVLTDFFTANARQVHEGISGLLTRNEIDPVDAIPDSDSLSDEDRAKGLEQLEHMVVIKLNGGLGTSMGLEKAKALLPVKSGLTFLDIIARQVLHLRSTFNAGLPLMFMTSYSTDADTLTKLAEYPDLAEGQPGIPLTFLQHRVPKLNAATLMPEHLTDQPEKSWCPPGHGDIYTALIATGLLDELLKRGFRYAFISNADNLGAVMEPSIVGMMARRRIPFLMEVTDRTPADRKGGHLARAKCGGNLLLRESAQCPQDETEEFQDITRYRFFNTNNLWVDLQALQDLVGRTGAVPSMALIVNRKTIDPRDPDSTPVLQLETAMGSAIASFPGAEALRVPRTRFAPVKTTDDLLGLWSDAFELTGEFHIRPSAARSIEGPPVVKLDSDFYKLIDDFTSRFPQGAPSLVNCRSLTVKGDYRFGPDVVVTGDCVLDNPASGQISVSACRLGA